ncbi:MAG: flagellar basal body-associated FliL family protein, partial [Bdellovibrionales bacterium]|nr:flagellar basal body-associated FliL family protein [Bdellovibrionales bacterium]
QIENYDPKDVVLLDDAFPQPHYTVLLNKIVLNLRRTSGHPNPMATFMFYVRVDSTETAIEIKDRQVELLDYVQRALEEMSYEEVNGPGGRLSIKAKTRAEINRVLNQGRVLDVLIEMMITKP